jgi:hypothetical protein
MPIISLPRQAASHQLAARKVVYWTDLRNERFERPPGFSSSDAAAGQRRPCLRRALLGHLSRAEAALSGAEVREAMKARIDHLVGQGFARRQGQGVIFARR